MKKMFFGIRKIFVATGVFVMTVCSKVLAVATGLIEPPVVCLYGVPVPRTPIIIEKIRNIGMPIIFLIGSIIYIKKSKSSKSRKAITLLIALAIAVGIWFGIEWLLEEIYYW